MLAVLPLHCCCPGMHEPPQAVPMQAYMQFGRRPPLTVALARLGPGCCCSRSGSGRACKPAPFRRCRSPHRWPRSRRCRVTPPVATMPPVPGTPPVATIAAGPEHATGRYYAARPVTPPSRTPPVPVPPPVATQAARASRPPVADPPPLPVAPPVTAAPPVPFDAGGAAAAEHRTAAAAARSAAATAPLAGRAAGPLAARPATGEPPTPPVPPSASSSRGRSITEATGEGRRQQPRSRSRPTHDRLSGVRITSSPPERRPPLEPPPHQA